MAKNILIAFYSHSGNTRRIAEVIHSLAGGTLLEIKPQNPYPRAYQAVLDQSKGEIERGYKPPLRAILDSIKAYDTIIIGTPNWYSSIAPPVATFLSAYDFSGKTIAPFCTHGGGGLGHIPEDIAKLCPGATIRTTLGIYGGGGRNIQAEVSAWLDKINILRS